MKYLILSIIASVFSVSFFLQFLSTRKKTLPPDDFKYSKYAQPTNSNKIIKIDSSNAITFINSDTIGKWTSGNIVGDTLILYNKYGGPVKKISLSAFDRKKK